MMSEIGISQIPVAISNPGIQLNGGTIQVSYDILNSKISDKYNIRLVISQANGDIIDATSLLGDVGQDISGGSGKTISWDLLADSVFLNAFINFTIYAKLIPPEKPITAEASNVVAKNEKIDKEKDDVILEDLEPAKVLAEESAKVKIETNYPKSPSSKSEFNRTGLILQSIPLPGLGVSHYTGKPHWLKGVAGYGCIVGALYFSQLSKASYADYSAATETNWQTYYQDVATWQGNISKGFVAGAVGIWVTDIIWTLLGTSDLIIKPLSAETNGFHIKSEYDPAFEIPMINLSYTF